MNNEDRMNGTINVIERVEGRYCQLVSFLNTKRGQESAERIFGTILREYSGNGGNELTDAQIEQYIEEGSFEDGTYELDIVTTS